ncbi:MAG: trigger factor [Lachnospiraceae bacterium]|nr:trigger factor [Lachnospiraceae bacterium]MDD7026172.1 trigger factor [Lachnospiraceae bacterium]MDY5699558.1 trigger factor [Lachnospiraceae bacterium]
MSLQVEKLEGNMAKLTIEVPAEELEKAINNVFQKQKKNISIPGFRKGKVPRQMIEKMYGKEVFYEDAANELIPTAYEKAYDECEEEIVSSPRISVVQLEAGKTFVFTAEVALKPEVELGQYKGIKVDKVEAVVTDEEVQAELEKERERNSRTISVTDRAVKSGDQTVIDFEGFQDGVAFEGGKGENYPLTIGSGTFIPGFEDQLIGKNIGEAVEVNVTFPESYQAENLAGKPAVFKVEIKEIKEKQLPELDDEFAAEVSEFDTLDEYKADVRANLLKKKEADIKNAKENAVIEAIIADAKMDIPEAMLETRQRQMVDEFAQRLQMQGLSVEQYFQFTGLNHDKLLEQVKPQAEQKIKSRLVLEAVVKAENIAATEEDFEKEIASMAEAYKMEADKVKEMLGEGGKEQIMEDIAINKAVEFVVDNAKESKPRAKKEEKTEE